MQLLGGYKIKQFLQATCIQYGYFTQLWVQVMTFF